MEEGKATLNKDLLLRAVGGQRLNTIQVLTLSGWKLTHCLKLITQEIGDSLVVLNLKGNNLNDIEHLNKLRNLRKVDLSSNMLMSLGDESVWGSMNYLQVLYLHDNLLPTLAEVPVLKPLTGLIHLTLFNNPLSKAESYQSSTIKLIPTLLAFDFLVVTNEERKGYILNTSTKVWLQDTTSVEVLNSHLYNLRRKWERASPSIRIQANWRGKISRKKYGGFFNERDRAAIKIQKIVRGFLLRRRLQKDLEELLVSMKKDYLMYSPDEYAQYMAVQKIETFVLENFINAKREFAAKTKAATLIQSGWRMYKASMKDLPLYRGKLYFMKAQQRVFGTILKVLCSESDEFHPMRKTVDNSLIKSLESMKPPRVDYSFKDLANCIKPCPSIKVVRFPELDNIRFSLLPAKWYTAWVNSSILVDFSHKKPFVNASLMPMYQDYPAYKSKLDKLKVRTRGCTDLKAKFSSDDEFFDLLEFASPSSAVTEVISRLALKLNKLLLDEESGFILLHEKLVKRVSATCAIQSFWRAHKSATKPPLISKLLFSRSAICIQRWWRNIVFHRRIVILTNLKSYLAGFNDNCGYVQEHLFQALTFSKDTFKIPEQTISFFTMGTECFQLADEYERPILPKWIGLELNLHFGPLPVIEKEQMTLQAAMLTGAQISVHKLCRIVDNKSFISDGNLKFIKFEFSSIQELKRRAALLYLLSYDNASNSFILVFSKEQLKQEFLISKLKVAWNARLIDPSKPCISTALIEEALRPSPEVAVYKEAEEPAEVPVKELAQDKQDETVHHDRASTEITHAEVTNWRVKIARQQAIQKQAEASLNRSLVKSFRQVKTRIEKEKFIEEKTRKDRHDYASKRLAHRLRVREVAKQTRLNHERDFIKQFAQAKNMIEKSLVRSDLRNLRNKSLAANASYVKSIKERWQSVRSNRSLLQEVRKVELGSDLNKSDML